MRRKEPTTEKGLVGTLLLFFTVLLIIVAFCLLSAKVSEAQDVDMVVDEARTDGPIYDLPDKFKQQIVLDNENKEYMLIWYENKRGRVEALDIEPLLDSNGKQMVMDQA